MRVWQVAQSSEDWMWSAFPGRKPEAERMTVTRPESTSKGPNTRRSSRRVRSSTSKPPTKLSSVPKRSVVRTASSSG